MKLAQAELPPGIIVQRHDGKYIDVIVRVPGGQASLCLDPIEAVELLQKLKQVLSEAN